MFGRGEGEPSSRKGFPSPSILHPLFTHYFAFACTGRSPLRKLENLIHGDAAHLFEGFFGERADMRRKEHIRQGGEGAWMRAAPAKRRRVRPRRYGGR